MATLYVQYSYSVYEAKPTEYNFFEDLNVNGKAVGSRWGVVFDPNETWDRTSNEYSPNTGYDYFQRQVVAATFTRPNDYGARFELHNLDPYIWTQFAVEDSFIIPPELGGGSPYGTTGPNGIFAYNNAEKTEVKFGPTKYDFSSDVVGSVNFGSLVVSTQDTLYTLAENAAAAAGFSGLSTAIKNVATAKNALENVATNGMQLVSSGIKGFGNPYFSHRDFDAQAEQFMRGAGDTFERALIDQTLYPGNPVLEGYADNILQGIQLVGTAGQSGTLPISAAAELVLRVEAGPAQLEATFTGTLKADVIIQPGRAGTVIDGSDGNDFIVAGSGNNRLIGGSGNDYLFAGRGDDVLIAGPGSTALLDGGTALPGDYYNGGPGTDTAIFSAPLSEYRPVSAGIGNSYLWGTSGGTYTKSVEVLQFADGSIDTVSNSPLIDNLFYASHNLDVFHAAADPAAHYASYGWWEGRDPNPSFTTGGYLSINQDVKAAGINPLEHYHQYGWKEGRDPSVTFDTQLYLLRNPDVAAAGVDPLNHYLSFGQAEGRQSYAAVGKTIENGFDRDYYLLANPDIGRAGLDPLQHFLAFGWREGRNPNAYFDTSGYLGRYADVMAAQINPLDHYNSFGWREGRDPSAQFDTSSYLTVYSDVAVANINPLQHFLSFGMLEGRSPFSDGYLGDYTISTGYDLFV
jgi:Ca2+-binding RTX toxin-like protein